ncbi:hypothetical protein KA005_20570, partial [bacterium]|nr:hypothetical protein [bacterium]
MIINYYTSFKTTWILRLNLSFFTRCGILSGPEKRPALQDTDMTSWNEKQSGPTNWIDYSPGRCR